MRAFRGVRATGVPGGRPGPLHSAFVCSSAERRGTGLRAFPRELARKRPRLGWRRWVVNNKRVHRLRREESVRVPYRKEKPLRSIGVRVGGICRRSQFGGQSHGLLVRPDNRREDAEAAWVTYRDAANAGNPFKFSG